ncbi:PIN domain-containing protein [PVC group bacterium]|nr:PIN domain-containing protein [PVC group bacterium]
MAILNYQIFFDTSVYIAAILSPKGAAGELIRLVEVGAIRMVVSEKVIIESDHVLSRKFPDLIEESRNFWKHLEPNIIPEPEPKEIEPFAQHLDAADAMILCAAHLAKVDAFVTWNTRDFIEPSIEKLVSFPIVVPGNCLKLFQKWIKPFLD